MAHNIRKREGDSGPPLAVVWRRIEALRPDPANPRSHSPKQIRQLARSIGAFGFNVPILVDRTLRILAGHGRLLAAQELGWREVPTILLDHLSEAEARAFMIADNRLAESAAWNNTLLSEQLREISLEAPDFAIETTGFELSEIDLLTGGGALGMRKPSRRPTPRTAAAPTVTSAGEWWLLGRHRVGCGNLADAVDAMLADEKEGNVVVVLAGNPATVDTIIRRWQAQTGDTARQMASGRSFAEPATTGASEPSDVG
jgi:ParB-like chromosome segregation protein Spo0J